MKVISNLAISLDGRIAYHKKAHLPLGTPYDRRLMKKIRESADAVLFGSKTLAVGKVCAVHGNKKKRELINVVFTQSGVLAKKIPFWSNTGVKRIVFTVDDALEKARDSAQERAFVSACGKSKLQLKKALKILSNLGVKTALVEGGGILFESFLKEKLLDEMYLTLTPKILGSQKNPLLVPGKHSFYPFLESSLLSSKAVGNEIYLHYKIKKAKN